MKNTAIAIVAAAIATSASANVLDMQYISMGPGSDIRLHLGGDIHDTFAGELNHEISNASAGYEYLNGMQRSFCPDRTQNVSASAAREYCVTAIENIPLANDASPMGALKADAMRSLYASEATTLLAGGLSNAYAAAFQLVMWEIVDDFDGSAASIDVDAGNIIVTQQDDSALDAAILAEISTLTTNMMNSLASGGANFQDAIGMTHESFQDQIVLVPAPGAMALMTIGGLMVSRRRRD